MAALVKRSDLPVEESWYGVEYALEVEELDCDGALKNMGHMTSGVTLRVCVVDAMPTNVGNKMPSL
jgi:hypothetical protein